MLFTMVVLVSTARAEAATTLPSGFKETTVLTGLSRPTAVSLALDGRVFVGEKSGLIKVYDSFADPTPDVFADLRTDVYNFWDRGLMSIALDPQFPTRPYLYALYARDADIGGASPKWGRAGASDDPCPDPPGITNEGCVISGRLVRLTAFGNISTETKVLVDGWCQQFGSHSLGSIQFGADGALYASGGEGANYDFADYGQMGQPLNPCGDPPGGVGGVQTAPTAEGGALRAQDLRTMGDPAGLNGSVIRVNPDTGDGMPDNPFASSTDANARRILAEGLRNPYRTAMRPGTNELWIDDVGWAKWEELDRVTGGGAFKNFGWPCYEGTVRDYQFDSLDLNLCERLYSEPGAVTMPYAEYNRNDPVIVGDGCPTGTASEAGITFYPTSGGSYPGEYAGALFWQDYSRQCMWAMEVGAGGVPDPAAVKPFASGLAEPVYLTSGPGGDLYYLGYGGGQAGAGTLRRIQYFAGNTPPTARATATPTGGAVPLTVQFNGSGSTDPDGDALTYSWDLNGDGAFGDSTSVAPSYTYTTARNVTVQLRVTDARGATGTATVTVSPGNTAPEVTIAAPSATTTFAVGQTLTFSGSASDAQDGALPPSALSWSLVMKHCPSVCHSHPIQDYPGVASGSFTGPDHEYPSYLELTLTATDSAGLKTSKTLRIDPTTATLSFTSVPTGLQLVVNGISATTPFTRTVILGSTNAISAPSPQALAGTRYDFASWSDGAAQTHNVVASADRTYGATYASGGPATAANLLANGRFEGSTDGWDGWQSTLTLASDGVDGPGAALVKADPGATDFSIYPVPTPVTSTVGGKVYTASAFVRSATPGKTLCLRVREQSSAGLVLGSSLTCLKATSVWQRFPDVGYIAKGGGALDTYVYEDAAAAGDSFEVDAYTLTDSAPPANDTAPPTVAVTAPSAGGLVRGIYYLSADATDNSGISKVEFLVNGTVVGTDANAPYSIGWSSTVVPDGAITVAARATDTAGNAATSPTVSAIVDNTAPDTNITGGPTGTVAATSASFTFTSNEAQSTYQCSIDAGTYTPCTSPTTYNALTPGAHSFSVYATDRAGNVDQTPAARSWSVNTADTTPPETTIDSGPSGTTTATSATFAFSASENGTFECQLDGGTWAACVSPQSYTALAIGAHTFAVRATDGAGNTDPTPATRSWSVGAGDTTPPDTAIDSGPSDSVSSTTATFTFSSSEGASTFECRLDSSAFATCSSPVSYSSLAVGSHTFSVRAIDAARNVDPTPATRTWSISSTAPPSSNLMTNGDFEAGLASWRSWNGTLAAAGDGIAGPTAAKVSVSGTATGYSIFPATRPVGQATAGTTYSAGGWVRSATPGRKSCLTIREWTSAGAILASAATCVTAAAGWQQFPAVTYTVKQSGGQIEVYASQQNAVAGDSFEVDGLTLTTGGTPADTTPPDTTITSGPPASTTRTDASFAFSANEPGTFTCSLDNAAWTACTSPRAYSGLAAGSHTFQVRATDTAGNTDPTPAGSTWTIAAPADTTPPETTIDSGPSGTTSATSATFTFSANEPATFACQLDGAAWAPCSSPAGWTGFPPGTHTFSVRATDTASNTDPTPATRTWTVAQAADTTPPETTIDSGPSGSVTATDASFGFSSSEAGSTFACALDGGAFASCTSPKTYTGLTVAAHTFSVRATDPAGNADASPATRSWTVQAPPAGANLLPNGNFESGIGNWRSWNGTLSLASDGKDGPAAGKATLAASGQTSYSIYPSPRPVTGTVAGTSYTASGWVRSDVVGRKTCLTIREWSSSGAVAGSAYLCVTTALGWQLYPTVTYKTLQSGGQLEVYASQQNAVAGDSFEVDGLTLAKSG